MRTLRDSCACFNDTVEPVVGRTRLEHASLLWKLQSPRRRPPAVCPMFPDFLDFHVDEMHLEMASREFAEIECIEAVGKKMTVAIGVIDVKSYYIETPEDVAERVRRCLQYAPPERLAFAPDCGLSQTARWAAKRKLQALVEGVAIGRREIGE